MTIEDLLRDRLHSAECALDESAKREAILRRELQETKDALDFERKQHRLPLAGKYEFPASVAGGHAERIDESLYKLISHHITRDKETISEILWWIRETIQLATSNDE